MGRSSRQEPGRDRGPATARRLCEDTRRPEQARELTPQANQVKAPQTSEDVSRTEFELWDGSRGNG